MIFKLKEKGYLLIEVVVAAGIFTVVLVIVAGIFISEISAQKKIYNMNYLQNEGNFLMQKISKEIRMLKTINSSQEGNTDSDLEFENYDSEPTVYCQSDSSGNCAAGGAYLARNGKVISSPEVVIENLKFYTSDNFATKQPLVTVILKVRSAAGEESLMLQNSLAMRFYN